MVGLLLIVGVFGHVEVAENEGEAHLELFEKGVHVLKVLRASVAEVADDFLDFEDASDGNHELRDVDDGMRRLELERK